MRKLVDLKYGFYEDVILFAVGIYSLILLIKHWKIIEINILNLLTPLKNGSNPASPTRLCSKIVINPRGSTISLLNYSQFLINILIIITYM